MIIAKNYSECTALSVFMCNFASEKAENDMKGITLGPAGGRSKSRNYGIWVKLAGQPALMPNTKAPVVVQDLTMEQIQAIPKSRFSVTLVEKQQPIEVADLIHMGDRRWATRRLLHLRHKVLQGRSGIFIHTRNNVREVRVKVREDGTKQYTAIIRLLGQLRERTDSLYETNLELSHNQRDTPPDQESDIFCLPINDGDMTDCIKKAIVHFFGDEDTCKIRGKEYKPAVFCLLMHYYFSRINILKNKTRTPFCNYLQKRVLRENLVFTSRTFTGYALEYKEWEPYFTEKDKLSINFNVHPDSKTKPLQAAFHEIGHFFHTSPYFDKLREMRKSIDIFQI